MKNTERGSSTSYALRKDVVRVAISRLRTEILHIPPISVGTTVEQLDFWRGTLSELGPVFSHFGRYLGTRNDLFHPEVCGALLETGTVAVLANQQLAEAHQIRYPDSDAASLTHLRPDKDRSDHLTHYYRWPGEMHLSLRLLNPEFLALWDADQKLLELLTAPAKKLWPTFDLKKVIADFRASVEEALELETIAQSYRNLVPIEQQNQQGAFDLFALSEIDDEFCGAGILGFREPTPDSPEPTAHAAYTKILKNGSGHARTDLARDLCVCWLNQALRGTWFPVDLTDKNLGVAKGGKPAFLGGPVATIDRDTQDFLFRYLCAVSASQPDVAADILVSQLNPTRHAKGIEEVRDLFRQIVPFRDGQINENGDHELFAEHILIQLRVIREAGYPLRPELVNFQRSLASVARTAHALSPRRDTFKDALYEFRWTESLTNLRNMFTLGSAMKHGQDFLNLLMEIPEKMNLAAQGRGPVQSSFAPNQDRPPKRSSAALLIAHISPLLIIAWLFQSLLKYGEGSPLIETLLVLSSIGISISLIRCLIKRE